MGAQLVFDWRPTERLKIEAGIRYDRFWAFDDVLARARARRDPNYAVAQGIDNVRSGVAVPYLQIMTQEEIDAYNRARAEVARRPDDWEEIYRDFYRRYGFFPSDWDITRHNPNGNTGFRDGNDQYQAFDESQTAMYRPMPARIAHYYNRKFNGPLFPDGFFEERVENPQGRQGSFYRYLLPRVGGYSYSDVPILGITHDSYGFSPSMLKGDWMAMDLTIAIAKEFTKEQSFRSPPAIFIRISTRIAMPTIHLSSA